MNPDLKREFTPYAFGCLYFKVYERALDLDEFEEIASVFYTKNSKAWSFFLEGMRKSRIICLTLEGLTVSQSGRSTMTRES